MSFDPSKSAPTNDVTRSAAEAVERLYWELNDALNLPAYFTDAEGRIRSFNAAAVALWGRTPVLGHDRWCGSEKMRRPDGTDLPLDQCPMAVALRTGEPATSVEAIVERPDGELRYVLANPHPFISETGEVTGGMDVLIDITEYQSGKGVQSQLAAIVESSDDAIVSKNLDGVIESWNSGAERLFGYTASEVIGQSILILIPTDRHSEEPVILERIRRGERVEHYETVRRHKDGRLIDVSLTISPVHDHNGRVIGASKIARDITERKRAELETSRAHQAALAASQAKDDFLAALSHELRTPLNPVLLVASNAAEDGSLPDSVRAAFGLIRDNVQLEARLIDDLLDLTRISRGKLSLDLNPLALNPVIDAAISATEPELKTKHLTLVTELAHDSAIVQGDAVRLQQVFLNLLKNAVKFTPEGGRIVVESKTNPQQSRAVVNITDTGIGMTKAELGRVFEAFAQGNHAQSAAHRFGGLGLGLAISRTLVERHGGSITATSGGVDCGATFTVELPTVVADAAQRPADGSPEIPANLPAEKAGGKESHRRILLVEDHGPTRAALAHLLHRRGFETVSAGTAEEARTAAAANEIDWVISDIGLPDATGYELMADLRAAYDVAGIALTGYGMEQDVARSRKAGFAAHLIKPITIQALDAALAELDREGLPSRSTGALAVGIRK